MLERTLVVAMGEFGRSPKVNGGGGRDHWNFCYGLLMAGGGLKPGYVHGASDKIGARPSQQPVTPADVIATVYESWACRRTWRCWIGCRGRSCWRRGGPRSAR